MYWREIREADLPACLEIQTACLGDRIVGRETAVNVWKSLLDNPGFQGMVIESEPPIAGYNVVACGMGVFVSPQFADRELSDPKPGLNSRIIAGIASGQPILLSYAGLGLGNARHGVDFVNMYGTWREGILNPDQMEEVRALLGISFVEHFAGYRFNRILKEAVGAPQVALTRATGLYRLAAEFPESKSALAVVSRESAAAAAYSLGALLYRTQSHEDARSLRSKSSDTQSIF